MERTLLVHYCNANTGPIFLTYKSKKEVNVIIRDWIDNNIPVYNFISSDGHHRTAVADEVANMKREENPSFTGDEEFNGEGYYKPDKKHSFGMYLDNKWYKSTKKKTSFEKKKEYLVCM